METLVTGFIIGLILGITLEFSAWQRREERNKRG